MITIHDEISILERNRRSLPNKILQKLTYGLIGIETQKTQTTRTVYTGPVN